jgi:hypothetical protein
MCPLNHQPESTGQQHNILVKCLPVTDNKCIAETAAIFYRIGNGNPQGERRKKQHA